MALVRIVLRDGECGIKEIPGMPHMEYDAALEMLRGMSDAQLRKVDLQYIRNGQPWRMASWQV